MDTAATKPTGNIHQENQIKYYSGASTASGVPATLRWRGDTIELVSTPQQVGASPQLIFRHHPSEIKQVLVRGTVLIFVTEQAKYKIEFGYWAGVVQGAGRQFGALGGLLGGMKSKGMLDKNGYSWWIQHLAQAGVPVKKSPLAIIIVLGLLVLLAFIIFLPRAKQ